MHQTSSTNIRANYPVAGNWREWLFGAWVVAILLLPVLVLDGDVTPLVRHIDVRTHAIVELFCGVTAMLIAALLWVLSRQYHEGALRVFAFGFLFMGALDLLHAAIHPAQHPGGFVASHTVSTLSGALLLCIGAARYFRAHRPGAVSGQLRRSLVISLLLILAVAAGYHLVLPSGGLDELYSFSFLARRTHEISGLLYAAAAVLGVLLYLATRQLLALVASGMLLLFAQSAYLFRFSHVWDTTWWLWHAVKVAFYTGTLVVIATGLVIALRAVERARRAQADANQELHGAHRALAQVHRELQVRNDMVSASIRACDLDQTLAVIETTLVQFIGPCRYELILRVRPDEVAEWQRDLQRRELRRPITVTADGMPCSRMTHVEGTRNATVQMCGENQHGSCMCLALQAHDQVFGYVRADVVDSERLYGNWHQLEALAAEVGPIVDNALLHYRWQRVIEFRSSLSRVAGLLSSSLELQTVLGSVCRESTQLLDSDGAAVFLAEEDGSGLRLASRCLLEEHGTEESAACEAPWLEAADARSLLGRLQVSGRPVALVKPESTEEPVPFPLNTPGCGWSAVAMFPMFHEDRLMGLVVSMRRDRIAFSRDTLVHGELLAEQVRVAIVNARAYQALRETNERLRHAEAERLRAERLAVLGQMAASVAHEIRNPLSAINNCLSVLRRGTAEQPKAASAVSIIDEEVQRLERLTRNFISFGRSRPPAPSAVSLQALTHRVCDGIVAHIRQEQRSITVTADVRDDEGEVLFDADGYQEVMWNLLLNAVQAIGATGAIRIRASIRRDHLFLAVADTGPGVARADRARIFEPFHSQRSQGAGLGLAIVQQHIEAWSGRLRVWGPPGACFSVYCPLVRNVEAGQRHASKGAYI